MSNSFSKLYLVRVVKDDEAGCFRFTVSIDFRTTTGRAESAQEALLRAQGAAERLQHEINTLSNGSTPEATTGTTPAAQQEKGK